VDGTGSGSCSMAGSAGKRIAPWGSAARGLPNFDSTLDVITNVQLDTAPERRAVACSGWEACTLCSVMAMGKRRSNLCCCASLEVCVSIPVTFGDRDAATLNVGCRRRGPSAALALACRGSSCSGRVAAATVLGLPSVSTTRPV
jgi:hypothetical protein